MVHHEDDPYRDDGYCRRPIIFPVVAPAGTVALICVSEFTVNVVAAVPLKLTRVAPVNPVSVKVAVEPTGPLTD